MEALKAAINNGANAVYFGLSAFSARAGAQNISDAELETAIEYVHLHSAAAYLALNTLLHEEELFQALTLAQKAWNLGIDGIIIQDLGLLTLLRRHLPHCPLHASTQMHLSSKEDLLWAKNNGFKRVVLPRELSLEDIQSLSTLAQEIDVELEVFIHGALCVSYSGLCLFSSLHGRGERSGNRGSCAQPCRQSFQLHGESGSEGGRLLSPKDQSALPYLFQLKEAGVTSFKIEGRMKDAAYSAVVTSVYREALDLSAHSPLSASKQKELEDHLLLAFNRGGSFTRGFFPATKDKDLLAGNYSGRFGLLLGKLVDTNSVQGKLIIQCNAKETPSKGDYLSIRIDGKELASFPVGKLQREGNKLVVLGLHPQLIYGLPLDAEVYQMSQVAFSAPLIYTERYKTPVNISITHDKELNKFVLSLQVSEGRWQGISLSHPLPPPEESYPLVDHQRLQKQLCKTNNLPFQVNQVEIAADFICQNAISIINEWRREIFSHLAEVIVTKNKHHLPLTEVRAGKIFEKTQSFSGTGNSSEEKTHLHYYSLKALPDKELYPQADSYSFSLFDVNSPRGREIILGLLTQNPQAQVRLWLPGLTKNTTNQPLEEALAWLSSQLGSAFQGVISGNLSENSDYWLHEGGNLFNHVAVETALKQRAKAVALSAELLPHQAIELLEQIQPKQFSDSALLLHRYGRSLWMQSEYCPIGRNRPNCKRCHNSGTFYLERKEVTSTIPLLKDKAIVVLPHPGPCSSELLGPLSLSSSGEELLEYSRKRGFPVVHLLRFFDETLEQQAELLANLIS